MVDVVGGKAGDIRLVGFDFDGTLVQYRGAKSAYGVIDRLLGCEVEDEKLRLMHSRGELSIAEWTRLSVEMYIKRGLTKAKFAKALADQMVLTPGAEALFSGLVRKGVKTAVFSGGLKNAYDVFVEKFGLRADYVTVAGELNFGYDGALSGYRYSEYDYHGKIGAMKEVCSELGCGLQECAFVGDGLNDIPLFGKVGLPVAINTDDERVLSAAKVRIRENDISALLGHI